MQTTPLSGEQRTAVLEHFPKKGHQNLFESLPPNHQITLFTLFDRKMVNGEIIELFEQGAPAVREFLNNKEKELMKEEENLRKSEQLENEKKRKEEQQLMSNLVGLMLGMMQMDYIKATFNLTLTNDLYTHAIEKLKEKLESLKRKYLAPVFSAYKIEDEAVMERIHQLALQNFFSNLFALPSCQENNQKVSTQEAAYAQLASIKYREDIFGFTVADSDDKVVGIMKTKQQSIILTAAETYAAKSGTPLHDVIVILDKYSPTVLQKVREAILAA